MSNIITIKLKLKNKINFGNFQNKFSNVVRYAFNRYFDGYDKFTV